MLLSLTYLYTRQQILLSVLEYLETFKCIEEQLIFLSLMVNDHCVKVNAALSYA